MVGEVGLSGLPAPPDAHHNCQHAARPVRERGELHEHAVRYCASALFNLQARRVLPCRRAVSVCHGVRGACLNLVNISLSRPMSYSLLGRCSDASRDLSVQVGEDLRTQAGTPALAGQILTLMLAQVAQGPPSGSDCLLSS